MHGNQFRTEVAVEATRPGRHFQRERNCPKEAAKGVNDVTNSNSLLMTKRVVKDFVSGKISGAYRKWAEKLNFW